MLIEAYYAFQHFSNIQTDPDGAFLAVISPTLMPTFEHLVCLLQRSCVFHIRRAVPATLPFSGLVGLIPVPWTTRLAG